MTQEITCRITATCPTCQAEHDNELTRDEITVAERLGLPSGILCDACSELAEKQERAEKRIAIGKRRWKYVLDSLGIPEPSKERVKVESGHALKLRPNPGIYLHGDPRGGKTCIAALIAKGLIWDMGRECEVIQGTDLKWLVNPDAEDVQLAREYEHAWKLGPILLFDDLDKRKGTGAAVEYIYRLLNHRLERGMPTIITANASLPELSRKLNGPGVEPADVAAIMARIQQHCQIVKI